MNICTYEFINERFLSVRTTETERFANKFERTYYYVRSNHSPAFTIWQDTLSPQNANRACLVMMKSLGFTKIFTHDSIFGIVWPSDQTRYSGAFKLPLL